MTRLDAAVHLELVDLDFEDAGDAVQALDREMISRKVLLLVDADEEVRRDRRRACLDRRPHGVDHRVVVQVVRQLHVLLEQRHAAAHRGFSVAAGLALLGEHLDDDAEEALVFLPLDGAGAIDALDQHLDVAVGQLQALDDVGDAAHRVDVFGLRIVDRGVVLRGEKMRLSFISACSSARVELGPSDHERHHHVGKTTTSQRDDRQRFEDFQGGCHI